MSSNALEKPNNVQIQAPIDASILERVLAMGDLSKLTSTERLSYLNEVCRSLGLNPLTRPFDFISLNGKLTMYAKKDCTEQLRNNRNISLEIVSRDRVDDLYIVRARAIMPDGRHDEDEGTVSVRNKSGDDLANAMMKAVTKAKRRVTLSICGLGQLDESELDTIPNVHPIRTQPAEHKPHSKTESQAAMDLQAPAKEPIPQEERDRWQTMAEGEDKRESGADEPIEESIEINREYIDGEPISEPQKRKIRAVAAAVFPKATCDRELHTLIMIQSGGVEHIDDLSKRGASLIIDALDRLFEAKKQQQA